MLTVRFPSLGLIVCCLNTITYSIFCKQSIYDTCTLYVVIFTLLTCLSYNYYFPPYRVTFLVLQIVPSLLSILTSKMIHVVFKNILPRPPVAAGCHHDDWHLDNSSPVVPKTSANLHPPQPNIDGLLRLHPLSSETPTHLAPVTSMFQITKLHPQADNQTVTSCKMDTSLQMINQPINNFASSEHHLHRHW